MSGCLPLHDASCSQSIEMITLTPAVKICLQVFQGLKELLLIL
jgi:hypothetical protein